MTYRGRVLRAYRFATAPKWLIGHVVVLAMAVTMVLLGRWQLDVSDSKHFSLQNFGYALQWWAFTAFTLAMWGRIVRDAGRARVRAAAETPASIASAPRPAESGQTSAEPVAYRRYVMPQRGEATDPASAGDSMLADYNDYLARLAAGDPAQPGRKENR